MTLKSLTLGTAFACIGTAGLAHEFTAGLYLSDPLAQSRLADVVNGFLLATEERDSHANETSDGHLGGLDVQILPMPAEYGDSIEGLYRRRVGEPDVVVVFGDAAVPDLPRGALIVEAGTLPSEAVWQQSDFAVRYREKFYTEPSQDAAQGYNAARRLDHAIRPLGGLTPIPEFETAITSTVGGMEW